MPLHLNFAERGSALRISEIPVGSTGGMIGVTFAPGKKQRSAMSGSHDREIGVDLDIVARWNAAAVVTLVESFELEDLQIPTLGREVEARFMEWHHLPIRDVSVPDASFEAAWDARSAEVRSLLNRGNRILVHCKGGLGRAGMIASRLLVEVGAADAADAIAAVRAVRPGAVETTAQEDWVAKGRPMPAPEPGRGEDRIRNRALGALLGLAVGDAVGTTLEFTTKPHRAKLTDMVGGGPFNLPAGAWTDDTAMSLALADSLLADPDLDPADLMQRFTAWYETGAYSCTGTCFDIGNATRDALERFRRTGNPLAGSTDPRVAGNGALMRLAPVAIRHAWSDPAELRRVAEQQTLTTHGSPETIMASVLCAELLAALIRGEPLTAALAGDTARKVERLVGSWRGLHPDAVRGSGYVVHTLHAALWAVSRTTNFRSAVLLAANLGEDADTVAAVTGQIAGVAYGVDAIPADWLAKLAWHERINDIAGRLHEAGCANRRPDKTGG